MVERRREGLAGPSEGDTRKRTESTAQGSEPSDGGPTLPLPRPGPVLTISARPQKADSDNHQARRTRMEEEDKSPQCSVPETSKWGKEKDVWYRE